MAEQLPEGLAVYGLQAPGLEGEAEPLESVEDLAAYYLQAIRRVQPSGPYRLGGWSFGGLVALEMAQRLSAIGEAVEWLGLLDSFVLTGINPVAGDDRAWFAAGARQYLEQLGISMPVAEEELARHDASDQIEMLLKGLADSGMDVPDALAGRPVTCSGSGTSTPRRRSVMNRRVIRAGSSSSVRPTTKPRECLGRTQSNNGRS